MDRIYFPAIIPLYTSLEWHGMSREEQTEAENRQFELSNELGTEMDSSETPYTDMARSFAPIDCF